MILEACLQPGVFRIGHIWNKQRKWHITANPKENLAQCLSMLLVCKYIKQIVEPIIYSKSRFIFTGLTEPTESPLVIFLKRIASSNVDRIRSITLDFGAPTYDNCFTNTAKRSKLWCYRYITFTDVLVSISGYLRPLHVTPYAVNLAQNDNFNKRAIPQLLRRFPGLHTIEILFNPYQVRFPSILKEGARLVQIIRDGLVPFHHHIGLLSAKSIIPIPIHTKLRVVVSTVGRWTREQVGNDNPEVEALMAELRSKGVDAQLMCKTEYDSETQTLGPSF
jgi:hypothetical protein